MANPWRTVRAGACEKNHYVTYEHWTPAYPVHLLSLLFDDALACSIQLSLWTDNEGMGVHAGLGIPCSHICLVLISHETAHMDFSPTKIAILKCSMLH